MPALRLFVPRGDPSSRRLWRPPWKRVGPEERPGWAGGLQPREVEAASTQWGRQARAGTLREARRSECPQAAEPPLWARLRLRLRPQTWRAGTAAASPRRRPAAGRSCSLMWGGPGEPTTARGQWVGRPRLQEWHVQAGGVPTAGQGGVCTARWGTHCRAGWRFKARWGAGDRQVQFCMIQAALCVLQSLIECIDL